MGGKGLKWKEGGGNAGETAKALIPDNDTDSAFTKKAGGAVTGLKAASVGKQRAKLDALKKLPLTLPPAPPPLSKPEAPPVTTPKKKKESEAVKGGKAGSGVGAQVGGGKESKAVDGLGSGKEPPLKSKGRGWTRMGG